MPSVTIDAGVLAAPPEKGTAEDVHRYVETLLDWSQLLDEPWIAIYMSEKVSKVLSEDDLFPQIDELKRLFTSTGIVEYDAYTLFTVIVKILGLTPSFETFFLMRDVLTENLTTKPDILRLCQGSSSQSDLARCIVLIAILRHRCRKPVSDHLLILRHAPGRIIQVRAQIHMLEHDRKDLDIPPELPVFFEGDVFVCDDFRGLIECLDTAYILLSATNAIDVQTAVHIAIYKARLDRGMDPDWKGLPRFCVGKEFLNTFLDHHPTQTLAARLLQSMVDTLERNNMNKTHALRTGAGGENPQRIRQKDQAKAFRRDIDRDHHLHYWYRNDGLVEFASMSYPHDNFEIPE